MKKFTYKYDDLFNPCLKAIHQLGGSGGNNEIKDRVIEILDLSDEEINDIHKHKTTKLDYRLAWTRTYLKQAGLIESSARSVWGLTQKGQKIEEVDKEEIKRIVNAGGRRRDGSDIEEEIDEPFDEASTKWQSDLLYELKQMDPYAFEFLSQRLLRELGFKKVEVTTRGGDGGIDGIGLLEIGSVITFRVVFQCKRYRDAVSAGAVRDFRGALQGRADKGLIITTGRFTRDAKAEAERDGAIAIDLMNGDELVEKLKELELGVKVETVEKVTIDKDIFPNSQEADALDSEQLRGN